MLDLSMAIATFAIAALWLRERRRRERTERNLARWFRDQCDHSQWQRLAEEPAGQWRWCPRCGAMAVPGSETWTKPYGPGKAFEDLEWGGAD